jgi:tetratricopeptide (TPR) repeat protein
MKRHIISILTLLIISISLYASNNYQIFNEANEAYKKSQYDTAIVLYHSILKTGNISAEVYFNLGNAYYKKKDIANAILNFERAHKISPSDDEINFNLQLAQTMVVDKINSLPEFILFKWWRVFTETMSSDSWAKTSILFFISTLISIMVYLFARLRWLKVGSFWFAAVFMLFSLTAIICSYQVKSNNENHSGSIVMSASVTLKSSPVDNGTDIFVLHEGAKVMIIDQVGEWIKIKIADGNNGWLKNSDIEKI